LIDKFLAEAATATTQRTTRPRPSSNTDQLQERITKLRTENQQLRLHLDLYEEHIRRITIENGKLRTELGQVAGVTTINPRNHVNRRS
jgi:regulator of replication initiation timing